MKKTYILCVLAAVALFFSVNTGMAGDITLFEEKFDGYPKGTFPGSGGWDLVYEGSVKTSQYVGDRFAVSGPQSLHLEGSSCWAAAAYHPVEAVTNETRLIVEADVLVESMVSCGCTSHLASVELYNPELHVWGTSYGRIRFNCDGKIYAVMNTHYENLQIPLKTYVPGEWYHVAADVDLARRVFDVYINGELSRSAVPILNTGMPTGVAVMAGHGGRPNAWFDNVKVSRYVPNQDPVADAGPDRAVELQSCSGSVVALNGAGSSDPDGDALTYTWTENGAAIATGVTPTVTLASGSHTITLTVDDGRGGTAADQTVISVADTTPPVLNVTLGPSVLWPPNHKYVTVAPVITVSDACVDAVTVQRMSASSSEPDNGLGDGDTADDILINDNGTLSLRAERSGTGSGRIYSVSYQATDPGGNSSVATATVTVPHGR